MSYIIKSTSPFVSVKLTQIGRENLAQGRLNFSFWAIGDSEINYNREAIVDANPTDITLSATSAILRPLDKQPNIKSFILPSNTTVPFQIIDGSVLNVVKAIVNNEAKERGFFYVDASGNSITQTGSPYTVYSQIVSNTLLFGTNVLPLDTTTGITVGDLVLLKLSNPTLGDIPNTGTTKAVPNMWYRVVTIPTTDTVTLDRNLPMVSSESANSQIYVYKGGEVYESIATGMTTAYWDSGTLAFDASSNITCHDIPVWNMNNVWCENIAGITGLSTTNLYEGYTKFGSYNFLGQKNPYLEYLCESTTASTATTNSCNTGGNSFPDDVSKSISIIHFTNNSISSLYGEFFYTDVSQGKYLKLTMPDLMYHRINGTTGSGTTMGMKFIATGTTQVIPNSDIEYIELIEDPTLLNSGATSQVIGRVYPQLKTVVIHDDEIVAAMSYKSNRNWTLPELSAAFQAPSGGTSTGVLAVNKTMYLTYSLENTGADGMGSSLPCQKYAKITNNTASPKDVVFKINETDLLSFMRKSETTDGYGFSADKFKLLYQIVDDALDRPDPGLWKTYDFTTSGITGTGGSIDPKLLEGQVPQTTGFILDSLKDSGSTIFSVIELLDMPANTQPEKLQFGDETFFYGNLSTYIGATIYKTIFDLRINSSTFNSTTNPTRSKDATTNPPLIKVSEVGIYDVDNNLVCIGKLSTPIPLENGNTIMIELSMDF